ncbi:MAG: calcium/sodium antiporter [Candidatus Marinimicrobia bacterium]|nr:calcium/sodium antiporter [Candidatus Neomarinimicrobiota bacterium]
MLISLLYLLIGGTFLFFGADWLVKSAVYFANRLKISSLVIGLTVVAFGTSLPELVISLKAVLLDASSIAIGNIVGSNIANVGLVLGLTSLIFPMAIHFQRIKRDLYIYLFACLVFIVFLFDGVISRFEGFTLFIGLVIYTWSCIKFKREQDVESVTPIEKTGKALVLFVLGIFGLYLGAELFIKGAIELASILGVSEVAIGMSVVALGTSLPELSTCFVALFRKEHAISVGNIIGSNIFNILSVIGIVGFVKPIISPQEILTFEIPIMVAFGLVLIPLGLVKQPISRIYSFILVMVYLGFIYGLFLR